MGNTCKSEKSNSTIQTITETPLATKSSEEHPTSTTKSSKELPTTTTTTGIPRFENEPTIHEEEEEEEKEGITPTDT